MKKLSVLLFFFLFLLACSESNDTAGGITEDQGIVAIQNKEVAGVSQKGPFVKGSIIHLYEMDSTFAQTGKSFVGKISSDKGEFELKNINLVSSYALLEANGYYRNEVSGKVSSSTLTLNAITDLRNREHVNINLLTHLAYERIVDLISDGETLLNAKEQAEKEIFAAFGVKENFGNFEDLNVLKSGEGNAVLLAASVLVQGKLSEGDVVLLMANLSEDIAEDGSWDNDSVKTKIADVAFNMNLQKVRSNMESWNLGDSIPNFEKYVKRFWWNNYGLGECDAKREKDSSANTNSLSTNYKKNYVCSSGDWIEESVSTVEPEKPATGLALWKGSEGTLDVFSDDAHKQSLGQMYYYASEGTEFLFDGSTEANTLDDKVVETCKGVCGTLKFGSGIAAGRVNNYAGIGFNTLNEDGEGGNVKSWEGVCVTYTATGDLDKITAQIKPVDDYLIGWNNPGVNLKKTSTPLTVNLPWKDFKQGSWNDKIVDLYSYVLENAASFAVVFEGPDAGTAQVNIMQIGSYGSCVPVEKNDAVVQQAKKMETWIGAKKTHCVNTGVEDDGSSSVGCWWYADDAENGGFSKFTWPVEADERDLSPVIDACENGICGSVKLVAGESWKFPFTQFGFDLAGSKKIGVDISGWGGLCIAYSASGIKPRLDLVANDEAHYVEYNTFFSVLPISADTVLNVPWSNFKQESGWGVMVKRSEYLQRVASIRLYFNGGDEGAFVIKKIGVLGECE